MPNMGSQNTSEKAKTFSLEIYKFREKKRRKIEKSLKCLNFQHFHKATESVKETERCMN